MRGNNPMDLLNLLNSEPTALKMEEPPSLSSYNVGYSRNNSLSSECGSIARGLEGMKLEAVQSFPSPPASDYSPKPSHQRPSHTTIKSLPLPITSHQLALRSNHHLDRAQHREGNGTTECLILPPIDVSLRNTRVDFHRSHSYPPSLHPVHGTHQHRKDASHNYPRTCNKSLLKYASKVRARRELSASSDTQPPRRPNARRPPKNKDTTHSNEKYTLEQVHFIRYHKEDLGMSYASLQPLFCQRFQGTLRLRDQCFSSRAYRDNIIPVVDENWGLQFDDTGKVQTRPNLIRQRSEPEFKHVPFKLVERSPKMAVTYFWVSGEHRARAAEIIKQDEKDQMSGCLTVEGHWRHAIVLLEKVIFKV